MMPDPTNIEFANTQGERDNIFNRKPSRYETDDRKSLENSPEC